jgi:hypothetical protein
MMPSPFQMLDEYRMLYRESGGKHLRTRRRPAEKRLEQQSLAKSGRKNVNAIWLCMQFNPPERTQVEDSITVYEALACAEDCHGDFHEATETNVLEWECPTPDRSPEILPTANEITGYYATITVDGKEHDYSFNRVTADILPGQLHLRSSKGRCLFDSQGHAKLAVCFLRALDRGIKNRDGLSPAEAKFLRLSEEPTMMKRLINKHGTPCTLPGRGVTRCVFLSFTGFHLPGTGDSEATGVHTNDPHVAFARQGSDYYIGGFKGGRGLATTTGELSPTAENNMVWRNMSAFDRYCRISDASSPVIGHGRRAKQRAPKHMRLNVKLNI